MKHLFCILLLTLSINFCNAQKAGDTTIAKKGLCHTFKRKGIEIYLLTEPVRDYTVTGTVTDDDLESVLNALSGEETTRTLTQRIDVLIENASRKAYKKKFEFDAIMTEDGATGTCIKFN